MLKKLRHCCAGLVLLAVASAFASEDPAQRARELVERYPLIDTHIDVPYRVKDTWVDVTRATSNGNFDYPRAVRGGLNIPFMSIYTPAALEAEGGSAQLAHELIDSVEAMVARAPSRFMLVRSVHDVLTAIQQRKVGLAMGMENGSPLEGKLENVSLFARRGIRYITLTHSLSNHISDSSYDPNRQWHGLSEFGKEVVTEMNRVGVMIDVSHVSDEAFSQVLEITQTAVIASHSSLRHFTPGFERNMSDDMIRALAENGGVVQVNFGSSFITREANAFMERLKEQRQAYVEENGFATGGPEQKLFQQNYLESNPFPYATLNNVVDHFDRVIDLVGVNHVGIGSDFDGVGDSLPVGLKDVSAYPELVAEFIRRGYSEQDIAKILGGNLLRVWREVEAFSKAE